MTRISYILAPLLLSVLFNTSLALASEDPWKESYRLESVYQYGAALDAINNISSDNELVLLRRGWLNYLKGSHSKSIEEYKRAISRNDKSLDARLGIILPLLAQQRWREAAQNANKVLEISPWNYHAHVRLMKTEEALKQWTQLEKHARSVHQHYPSDADTLVFLARACMKLNKTDDASNYYRKLLELIPDHFEAKHFSN